MRYLLLRAGELGGYPQAVSQKWAASKPKPFSCPIDQASKPPWHARIQQKPFQRPAPGSLYTFLGESGKNQLEPRLDLTGERSLPVSSSTLGRIESTYTHGWTYWIILCTMQPLLRTGGVFDGVLQLHLSTGGFRHCYPSVFPTHGLLPSLVAMG